MLERFGNLVEQSGVKTNVELLTNPLVSSPLLIGFFRACIVLPTVELSDSDFQYTILHELTHCKRWDMFYKWLVQAVICIHWFNPFVYLMGREVERTCELSCDEVVIRELDVSGRLTYGDTLLNAIDGGGRYKDSIAAVTLCECAERLRERLDAISGFHKNTRFVCTLSIVLTCTFCWGAVSVGAYTILPPSSLELRSIVELTLEEPENTLEEPKISIVVTAQTENITVVQGRDTLQIDFYAQNPDENNIELMTPLSKGRWNGIDIEFFAQNSGEYHFQPIASDNMHVSKMLGVGSSHSSGMEKDRWIEITVPQQLTLYELNISTTSGNIRVTDCTVRDLQTDTQSGKIEISP